MEVNDIFGEEIVTEENNTSTIISYDREECATQVNVNGKRNMRESDEDEWITAGSKKGKISKWEITITCNEQLPKAFALAKLLTQNNIHKIINVKYLNPYKIRVRFEDEESLNKLCECQDLIKKGWRFNKDMEVSLSYGVIRDVELDLEEDKILQSIQCSGSALLISAKRLNRRDNEKLGWTPCGVVRLCFKGSNLPPYVYVDALRISVEPYIFPVSQCSRCWRLGHTIKTCASNKTICPKCGGFHANCETTTFKCVNCSGRHMALTKTCPLYKKERRLREIMAELNCTYKKALTVYVDPTDEPTPPRTVIDQTDVHVTDHAYALNTAKSLTTPMDTTNNRQERDERPTYAQVIQRSSKQRPTSKKKERTHYTVPWETHLPEESDTSQSEDTPQAHRQNQDQGHCENKTTFTALLSRMYEVILLKKCSLLVKVKKILKLCFDWVLQWVAANLSEAPWLELFRQFLNG